MKLAVISSGYIPSRWAHSINTMKHAQGFFKLGHDVEILTVECLLETKMKLIINGIYDFYDIDQKIKVRYFKDNPFFYFMNISILEYFSRLIREFMPKIRDIFDPEKRINKYCKKQKIEMSYCRSYRSAYYNIMSQIPTIIEMHTDNLEKPEIMRLLRLSKHEYFKGIITIHQILKKNLIKKGVPSNKILVLEDAVDIDKFDQVNDNKMNLRSKLKLPLDKKIIMYCGSLKPGKGIGKILKTAKIFDENVIFYIIGGEKKYLKKWKRRTTDLKITNVFFMGFVINKLIPFYLKSADILFMPYDFNEKDKVMSLKTTSPIKLFEYMASKKPIVSLNIPVLEKIVRNGKEAYLAKSDEVEDYAELIRTLLRNEYLAKRLADNAYKRVKEYTYKNRCNKILYFINRSIL